jgi:two-component system, cell cycle sensor histidine kinase and response regulator CckA
MSKILIVDDCDLNRQLLLNLLDSEHHLAWEAADGAEALQVARTERPDLIISDVLMPTMDGYEFVRQLRADPVIGQIPVIFITGNYLSREARALAASCGVSSILYRPCNKKEVHHSMVTALESAKHPEMMLPPEREEFDREHLQLLTDTLSEKSDQLSAVNLKLTALIELSHQLASERDPLKLLEEYSRVAREIIGAKWNALGVLSEDRQTLQHFHTNGLDDEIAKLLNPPSLIEGMFGKLLKDSRSYRIRILDGGPQAEGWPSDFPPLSSCLSLPIIFQERVYGWICLANKLGADEFSDEDEQLAVTLVAQMAAAYENATLYSEARRRTVELEREIAEREKAEESLRESEVRYRRLFEAARDGILILNAATLKITDVNPFMTELLGYSRAEFLGKELWEIGFFDDKKASQTTFRELQKAGYVRYADLPLQTKEGKPWEVEFVSNVYEQDSHQVIQCNIRDITERKLTEESRERLAAIVESSDDAIFSKTFEGIVTSWNASAERMYGYTAAEAIGQHLSFIIPPECAEELADILHNLECGTRIKHRETVRVRKDGSKIDVSISVSPIIGAEGRILGASTIAREITERKRAEAAMRAKQEELLAMTQQLWQSSKLATMGELTAGIAHELNNPLATVSLRTEFLFGQCAGDDPKQDALKIIEQEVERMAKLVGNLLQFSRRNHAQISTIDVYQEIENTLDFIEHHLRSHQVNVVREFADSLPSLHADNQQLRQVFLNLLTNASDAMPQGGTLTLRVTAGRTAHGASAIVIEFADTGTGIKPEDLLKVWEPFFTTKDEGKGTGLGLAICRRIVEEHKGTINIESEVGQGTTVRITLPATEGERDGTRSV